MKKNEPYRNRTCNLLIKSQPRETKLLNKLTVTELAELSGLSKSYISQVKHGKCPASEKLLNAIATYYLPQKPDIDHLTLFMQSRKARAVSPQTLRYYRDRLSKFVARVNYLKATRQGIERYLNSIPPNENGFGTRHASFRAIRAYFGWLNNEYGLPNPMTGVAAPILG